MSESGNAGNSPAFVTTRWSMVCSAATAKSPAQSRALEDLCRAYWRPLYAYVRRTGAAPDDARDLTQAFFARLLERGTLAQARAERGRFRTFLLTALQNFLADKYDQTQALKRGGGVSFLELDTRSVEADYQAEFATGPTPDAVFDRQWAAAVLDRAVARLREEFAAHGRERVFDCLKGFMLVDGEPEQFHAACAAAGITLNNGRVTLHRLRARFPALVREEVAQTVSSGQELEAELRYLLDVLSV
jgi:RNA polymerase sigma-70 factor (ECF subfamily)